MTEREFSDVVCRYRSKLVAISVSILHNRQDAEDAVQDATLRAWRFLDRFRGDSDFKTWLVRITMNSCYTMIRSNQKKHQIELIAVDKLETFRAQESLEDFIVNGDFLGLVAELVRELPETYRQTVWNSLEGESWEPQLGINYGAYKSRKQRGMKILQEKVKAAVAH